LFEEEANQNLGAAIQAYQTVANQFDKDRKLAATAIFRLGECYRKQGNTNDAATQYERILREFSDQPTLVTLSRQSLAGMGSAPPPAATTAGQTAASAAVVAEAEAATLEAQVAELKSLTAGGGGTIEDALKKRSIAVQQYFPNPVLTSLMQKRLEAEQKLAELQKEYGPEHAEVVKTEALVATITKQINEQVQSVMRGLEIKRTAARKTAEILLAQTGAAAPKENAASSSASAARTTSEAEEVKRIQAMIKDSPDLINARVGGGNTPLQNAAALGQLIVAEFLLANGADVGAKDYLGRTPLHAAALAGHKSMVELLLNHKASVQAVDNDGKTPLHLAAEHGYRSVAEILLAQAADVNAKDNSGSTALQLAAAYGFNSVADLLLAHGADINVTTPHIPADTSHYYFSGTPLCIAATRADAPLVEQLLSKGAQVNAGDKTPLSCAAQAHSEPVVKLLLAAHADPNAGRTDLPLAIAAYAGHLPILKLLLASGANPNTNSMFNLSVTTRGSQLYQGGNFTPLFLAVNQRHAAAAEELLRSKANPNFTDFSDPRGKPLLYEALSDAPTFKVLLEGGADPNVRTGGMPMLTQAVLDKNQPAVELLLAHQADVNATNNYPDSGGWTALHYAIADGSKAIAELLLKTGADVNARDKNGATPLSFAVRNGNREMAEWLLANKADPNERNNAGQTPLDFAKSQAQPTQGLQSGMGGYPMPVGVPAAGPQRQPPGTPATAPGQKSKPETMADLLRQHGALDDLPQPDRIEVRRRSTGYCGDAFRKGAQDWNQFTLLELIGVQYSFLAASPNEEPGGTRYWSHSFASKFGNLPFPDLAHVRIRRPAPDQKSWLDRTVDLRPVLESGDCAKDAPLEWGDVAEIPEADHPLNEQWPGFSRTELANLMKCLTRQVEIVINGQATNITLTPQINLEGEEIKAGGTLREPVIVPGEAFWLKPVLLQSKLVLTSSDLRHVKVTRHHPASGQQREWVVDCSEAGPAPDFWLRDGDKIEVPEKSAASAAAEAEEPPPSARAQPLLPSTPGAPARSSFVQQLHRVPQSPAAGGVGKPPLFEALPDAPTLKRLLEGGADPNVRTSDGTPLLVQAVRDKNQVAVELLLSHKADVNAADSDGWTPLDYAVADGLKAIVELLLKAGATVNARNPSGDTPLHIALRGGQRELAELLLAHKADPNVRNNAGEAPLALAQTMGLSLGMGGAAPLAPPSETPPAVEEQYYPSIGGVLYSPKPNDPELLNAGYHRDRSARTRKAECWEQRTRTDLSGRGGNTIWTGTDMIEFGGEGMGTSFGDGALYSLAKDTWAALPQKGEPSSRSGHAMVWTGKEMIVWGGFGGVWGNDTIHDDGARYNPSSDTWKPMATKNAPSARLDFPAVWTGREMLLWGGFTDTHSRYQGYHADAHLNTGGRYDPSSDSWKTITATGAPSKRCCHTLVWTGKEAIVWGGGNDTKALNDGGRYNLSRDSWKPISADGAPSPRMGHVAFWTGKEMIAWGGTTRETDTQGTYFENGARYNPQTDTWRPMSTLGAPKGRVIGTAVWTGTEMIVWGGANDAQAQEGMAGFDPNRYLGTGARYNPATDTWTEMTLTGAPSPRVAPSGVWTGEGLLFFGGYNGRHLNDTWFYSPSRTLYPYAKG
jgi:ankyrin repeat protein/N-acetylneuraminic acid mutarotase